MNFAPCMKAANIDDKVLDMQYQLLCSPKPKNSFLTPDHDILTI